MNKSNNAKSTSTSTSATLAAKANAMSKADALAYATDALAKANLAYADAVATAAVTYATVLRGICKVLADSGHTAAEVRTFLKENCPASNATIKRAVMAAFGRERSIRKDAHLVKYAVSNGMETLKAMVSSGKKAKAKDEGDEDGEAEGDEDGEGDEGTTVHTVETLSNLMATLDKGLVEKAIIRWSAMVGKTK